jgi:hypothetical protein
MPKRNDLGRLAECRQFHRLADNIPTLDDTDSPAALPRQPSPDTLCPGSVS